MSAATHSPVPAPVAAGLHIRRVVQVVIALSALLVAAGGAIAVLSPSLGNAAVASIGQVDALAAALVLVTGSSLVVSGVTAWLSRSDRAIAIIAFWAAASWMALELVGGASVAREARSLALLMAPLFTPLIVHLSVWTVRADASDRWTTLGLLGLYVVVVIAALGRSLTYEPFFDIHCAPICARGDNLLAVRADMRAADAFAALGALAAVAGGVASAVWATARLARERHGKRRDVAPVLIPSTLVGISLVWSAAVRLVMVPDRLNDAWLLVPMVALALSTASLGAGVTLVMLARMRRRASLQLLVETLSAAEGPQSLRATLARTLGDERLRVAYPVEGGGFIDEAGEPVETPMSQADRALTTIMRGGRIVALVEHDADLDPDLLGREIGAAAQLAVDNERLEATIRARLRELRASRARIVEAGDAARGRLERDLHDGAQQRLLAVSFELRLASAALAASAGQPTDAVASVDAAIEDLDQAIDELRELAHGIHPVVLREDGLMGALEGLADTSAVPIVLHGGGVDRCGAPAELAAYVAVTEAVRGAQAGGQGRVDVTVDRTADGLRLTVDDVRVDAGTWPRIEDRVGAAGGRVALTTAPMGRTTMTVELPCG